MSRKNLLLLSLLSSSSLLSAHLSLAADQGSDTVKTAEKPSAWQLELGGGSGFGSFQDIQVPYNDYAKERGDGRQGGSENDTHAGVALHGNLGLEHRFAAGHKWSVLNLDALQVRSLIGPPETQSSTYSRLQLSSSPQFFLPLGGGMAALLGAEVGLRRSAFANVSTCHYIDAMIAGGSLGLSTGGLDLKAYGLMAPWAQFGYSEAAMFGGQVFRQSQASLSEFGLKAEVPLAKASRAAGPSWIDVGVDVESIRATINDVSEYNSFGLNVLDIMRPSRDYSLQTKIFRVGLRRAF